MKMRCSVAGARSAAEKHGFIVRMGRSIYIRKDELGELIEKCRDQPKGQDCTDAKTKASGSSETLATPTSGRAKVIAQKLMKSSHSISSTNQDNTVELLRRNQ